ncbi:hypothetical protein ZIOFF_061990 [Zingiber officinale]|uniref:Uncharacterized protein n=1 Tax=Zingiber officinale TaxID=94328 RepID=A0A8J5F4W1_ZINOF|nr:hypothetical protein ZIOFF_061990 [Zingiber officinale]
MDSKLRLMARDEQLMVKHKNKLMPISSEIDISVPEHAHHGSTMISFQSSLRHIFEAMENFAASYAKAYKEHVCHFIAIRLEPEELAGGIPSDDKLHCLVASGCGEEMDYSNRHKHLKVFLKMPSMLVLAAALLKHHQTALAPVLKHLSVDLSKLIEEELEREEGIILSLHYLRLKRGEELRGQRRGFFFVLLFPHQGANREGWLPPMLLSPHWLVAFLSRLLSPSPPRELPPDAASLDANDARLVTPLNRTRPFSHFSCLRCSASAKAPILTASTASNLTDPSPTF